MNSRIWLRSFVLFHVQAALVAGQDRLPYRAYATFDEVLQNSTTQYDKAVRVTSPGTSTTATDHGFFFQDCPQFDPSCRYMLAMRVFFRERRVQPDDIAVIGVVDLKDNNRWIEIGKSTAWNWQQGCRLQWRPGSNEILWNDRDDSGTKFVCRAYDFRTGQRRTLPRPIYAVSPDGSAALTHDFERMQHGGTDYVGLRDPSANQYAPKTVGIWKMDLTTGNAKMIVSLADVVPRIPREALPEHGPLYFFREGWNLSGSRFIAFVKAPENRLNKAFSLAADGSDLRYLYNFPSHHCWLDDHHVMDFAHLGAATAKGENPVKGFFLYKDDNTGIATKMLWRSDYDGHDWRHPSGDWIICDTYSIDGWQYLFLFHLPTAKFVSLGRFAVKAREGDGTFRVDLHPRVSPDGNTVSIDSTHEFAGRQIYNIDISHIVTSPPKP